MTKVIIELTGGQTIPLTSIKGVESSTFTGFGVNRPVTVFQNDVATIDYDKNEWPVRLDVKNPAVSGIKVGIQSVKEIRLV